MRHVTWCARRCCWLRDDIRTTRRGFVADPFVNGGPGFDTWGRASRRDCLGEHGYDLYVPASLDDSVLAPVVIALHGRPGDSVESQAQLQPLADEEQFLVAYPRLGQRRWQTELGSADVDYMRELINELVGSWNADPEGIYVTGMSAGGDMVISIGLQLSDLVAAVAPAAPPGDPMVAALLETVEPAVPIVASLREG